MREWRFTIEERGGRFHILRNGGACGAKLGYATREDAKQAIRETQRWDGIVGDR